ncbi:MAG: adenylate/guanylate cyclase domain-containing protein [Spirochaetales bacterium]|nr:adenylate/guanylate cyclase domain-containing protein [Spirochaetales bacterium]
MGLLNDWLSDAGVGLIEFDSASRCRSITPGLVQILGLAPEEIRSLRPDDLFEGTALQDLFGPDAPETFQSYRAYLRTSGGKLHFCNVSGKRTPQTVRLVVQIIELPDDLIIDSGPFIPNVRAFQLVRRYVSPQIMGGIQEAVRQGRETIASENRVLTYLFADLVSFTSLAENSDPDEIVNLLNLSIGSNSSTILHWGGFIDKIMGDSIFAVFEEPLNAVIAAVEIQKQFNILNFFRLKDGENAIELRIGIHTGPSTIASIGTLEFMELTYIGDAVNTASRLEKAAEPGMILISQSTADLVQGQLELGKGVELRVKGKKEPLAAHYVVRVRFQRKDGKEISIGLDDDVF